ncbi:MAG: VOC family protein [Candidatus Thioglobus sp.]|nr:VOC family protein [Candidatus Thioglobus sp.]
MATKLEHANLCVDDVDGMIKFLQTAFPDFIIRHDETGIDGDRWVHIGNDTTYIALNNSTQKEPSDWAPYSGKSGVNHLGYMVDNAEQVRSRLLAADYIESTIENNHPFRKRVYFYDHEGRDWEFIEYLSENLEERNDYTLADK